MKNIMIVPLLCFGTLLSCSTWSVQTEENLVDAGIYLTLPIIIKASNDNKYWMNTALYLENEVLPLIRAAKPINGIINDMIEGMDKNKPEIKSYYETLRSIFERLNAKRVEKIIINIVSIIKETSLGIRHVRSF